MNLIKRLFKEDFLHDVVERLREAPSRSAVLSLQAELNTRHLIPDERGNILSQDGVLCREIKRDRRKATKCVTDVYVALLVDELQSSQAAHSTFKYHGSGTGTTVENANQTTLTTEVETRDTGTQAEGATGNIYKSVATHTYGGSYAITEHGLFNASEAGTLMDRSKFDPVNVTNGEKIEFTYQLTCTAGG